MRVRINPDRDYRISDAIYSPLLRGVGFVPIVRDKSRGVCKSYQNGQIVLWRLGLAPTSKSKTTVMSGRALTITVPAKALLEGRGSETDQESQ